MQACEKKNGKETYVNGFLEFSQNSPFNGRGDVPGPRRASRGRVPKATRSPLQLRFLVGNNKQIVEVQVPSTGYGKGTGNLKTRIPHFTHELIPVSRHTLNGVQVHKLNAGKAIPL